MDLRTFAVALAPVVGAEILLDGAFQLFAPMRDISALGDISVVDWAVVAVSFLVFPFWAGARVARASGKHLWSALGGVSVLLGTFAAATFAELFEASSFDSSWPYSLLAILLASPLNAVLGFIGGAFQRIGVGHVA